MLRVKFRIGITCCLVAMLFVGCSSQNGLHVVSDNFDQNKAAQTRVSLGLTYLKNGNFSQAKYNLDKAYEFAPRSAEVNYAMAYYFQQVSEIQKAEDAYQFAMALDPKNADITNSYGAFLCERGLYKKAKEYFLKAVNTSQYISSAETYENLAICSRSSGHLDDSVGYLRSAVNHDPSRKTSLYLLVEALIDTEQWQEAREVLRRYEKIAQVSPETLLMAIRIEEGSGNFGAAKDYTDMFIKVYPTHPEVIELIKARNTSTKKPNKAKKVLKKQKPVGNEPAVQGNTVSNSVKTGANNFNQTVQKVQATNGGLAESKIQTDNQVPNYHIVMNGENLYRISIMYNIKLQRLVEWNELSNASAIYDGMKLTLVSPNSDE